MKFDKLEQIYLVGIDVGGTNLKAAVFSAAGDEIASAGAQTPLSIHDGVFQERDMEILWQTAGEVIRKAITKAGIPTNAIAAVGCTGHGKGVYLWGTDDKPCGAGIASTDRRAEAITDTWFREGIAAKAREMTLQNVLACQPAALLAWIKQEDPVRYNRIRWVFEAKDYIRFRLTGEAFAEYTDTSGTSLLNLHTRSYDDRIFNIFGIPEMKVCLPPLKQSCEVCGKVIKEAADCTGLPEGIPVCGGMFDIDACALALQVTGDNTLAVITGTWSINEYITTEPLPLTIPVQHSLYCIPEYYLIEESSPTSAGNLEWVLHTLLGMEEISYSDIDKMVAASSPEDSKLIFIPFLYGSNSPALHDAAFLGMHNGHTRADILRAVYEGVVFSHKQHIDTLLANRNIPSHIRIAGGAANSDVWMQMFADVIGYPVEITTAKTPGSLGCVIAAAVCCGLYSGYEEAVHAMVQVRKVFIPNKEHVAVYQEKYKMYQKYCTGRWNNETVHIGNI